VSSGKKAIPLGKAETLYADQSHQPKKPALLISRPILVPYLELTLNMVIISAF
jgi:hypothetical protein